MSGRVGNYSAFYVSEPFSASRLGAHQAKDFCYYNLLRSWKGGDSTFPFIDSHGLTYNVRDGSDWDQTLRPRLRSRLRSSKNIILFLSSSTLNSRALREEIEYGVNDQGLPVLVIYPEFSTEGSLLAGRELSCSVKGLWERIPVFRDSMHKVSTLHMPMNKQLIRESLANDNFSFGSGIEPGVYFYTP